MNEIQFRYESCFNFLNLEKINQLKFQKKSLKNEYNEISKKIETAFCYYSKVKDLKQNSETELIPLNDKITQIESSLQDARSPFIKSIVELYLKVKNKEPELLPKLFQTVLRDESEFNHLENLFKEETQLKLKEDGAEIKEKINKLVNKSHRDIQNFRQEFITSIEIENTLAEIYSEEILSDFYNKEKEIKERISRCKKEIDNSYLPVAQILSKNIFVSEIDLPFDPLSDILKIKDFMSKLSLDELKKYWNLEENNIKFLLKKTQDEGEISSVGKDAKICSLLTRNSNLFEKSPNLILGIFALEAASKINEEFKYLIQIEKTTNDFTLASMLEYGFKYNVFIQLESLPINEYKKEKYISSYIKKKNILKTFIPVIRSINEAVLSISGNESIKTEQSIQKQRPYNIENWKQYLEEFKSILLTIEQAKEHELIGKLTENAGRWHPSALKEQSRDGIEDLMRFLGVEYHKEGFTEKLTISSSLDEWVSKVITSTAFLKPKISHNFDRLHLIAALLDDEKYLCTIDGEYSPRDLVEKIIERIAGDPSEENVIMAEQMYVRLMLVLNHATFKEVQKRIS